MHSLSRTDDLDLVAVKDPTNCRSSHTLRKSSIEQPAPMMTPKRYCSTKNAQDSNTTQHLFEESSSFCHEPKWTHWVEPWSQPWHYAQVGADKLRRPNRKVRTNIQKLPCCKNFEIALRKLESSETWCPSIQCSTICLIAAADGILFSTLKKSRGGLDASLRKTIFTKPGFEKTDFQKPVLDGRTKNLAFYTENLVFVCMVKDHTEIQKPIKTKDKTRL